MCVRNEKNRLFLILNKTLSRIFKKRKMLVEENKKVEKEKKQAEQELIEFMRDIAINNRNITVNNHNNKTVNMFHIMQHYKLKKNYDELMNKPLSNEKRKRFL